jgi:flavin reductase (DIM6/NTAB) family NADH-FMN oxidoreductase RutF
MTIVMPDRPRLDPLALRSGFSQFPSGVAAFCAIVDDEPVGLVASTLTTVSLDPALVSVCIQLTSRTWVGLRGAPRIGISLLAAHQESVTRQIAARDGDRFADIAWTGRFRGAVLIDGAAMHIEAHLVDELDAGDHVIALLAIDALTTYADVEPAVFHRSAFRGLV